MNFFEREIERLKRRIKKIEENPDSKKLSSNRLLYKLELNRRQHQLDWWKAGKPFACGSIVSPLLRAMGFEYLDAAMIADRAGAEAMNKAFEFIRAEGYPEFACDRTVSIIPFFSLGEIPIPSFIMASNNSCDNLMYTYNSIAHRYNIPVFPVSISFEATEETLQYVTAQLREMITYAEKTVPGIKYNEDKLLELQGMDRIAFTYYHQIYELKKRVPCPINPRDAFREVVLPSYFPHPELCLEWLKGFLDELRERAEKGVEGREERLRTIWTVTGYNNDTAPFDYLESKGVTLLMLLDGGPSRWHIAKYPVYGDETEYGRKLSPIEEMARVGFNCVAWSGLGDRWVDDIIFMAKELSCDFLINFIQSGCVQTIGLAKLIEETAERKLGIPTLQLEGRGLLMAGYDRKRVLEKMDDFIERCLRKKA